MIDSKEKVFADFKDLILTLKTDRAKVGSIFEKWEQKRLGLNARLLRLTLKEKEWVEVELEKWFKEIDLK